MLVNQRDLKSELSAHGTALSTQLSTHDREVKAALNTHDADMKAAIGASDTALSTHDRDIKALKPFVKKINELLGRRYFVDNSRIDTNFTTD